MLFWDFCPINDSIGKINRWKCDRSLFLLFFSDHLFDLDFGTSMDWTAWNQWYLLWPHLLHCNLAQTIWVRAHPTWLHHLLMRSGESGLVLERNRFFEWRHFLVKSCCHHFWRRIIILLWLVHRISPHTNADVFKRSARLEIHLQSCMLLAISMILEYPWISALVKGRIVSVIH